MLQFLAVILTALALVPVGAHLFELPHKITLSEKQDFIVQSIYRGWALFGIIIIAAIAANLLLGFALLRRGRAFGLPLAAPLILVATMAVFLLWTYPVNQATANWTVAAADWEKLRRQWKFSHAANALLSFIALCGATLSAARLAD